MRSPESLYSRHRNVYFEFKGCPGIKGALLRAAIRISKNALTLPQTGHVTPELLILRSFVSWVFTLGCMDWLGLAVQTLFLNLWGSE